MDFKQKLLKWFFLFELCIQFYIQLYFILYFGLSNTSFIIFLEYFISLLVYHDLLILVIVLILDGYLIYSNKNNILFCSFCSEFLIKNIIRWSFYKFLLKKNNNGHQKLVCFLLEKNRNEEENLI